MDSEKTVLVSGGAGYIGSHTAAPAMFQQCGQKPHPSAKDSAGKRDSRSTRP